MDYKTAEKLSLFGHVRKWYGKFERPISSLSLIGGFVFDAVTLTRVDEFWENFWVLGHLVIVGVCIILIDREEIKDETELANPDKAHFWFVNILQFFFGGLLSTFLVFYFRSGTVATSWPFFTILAAAFIANESLKKHYTRLAFQITLFFLSVYLFAIYIVPVLVHSIGPWIFILSGIVSLIGLWIFLRVLNYFAREKFTKGKKTLFFSVASIFIAINVLYFLNIIPPIPLSLKQGDVYQSFIVNGPGNYTVGHEDQGFFSFLELSPTIHITPATSLYAYSAIFSPANFNLSIVHEWQYDDPATSQWITKSRVVLAVTGGGDGGYRTFSIENNLTPGKWRVVVETTRGQVIGQMNFTVADVSSTPPLVQTNID
jgi:MFS family permease